MSSLRTQKKAQASLEAVIVIPMVIFAIFSVILSSMTYYSLKADTTQSNYEIGRYVSQMGVCNANAETPTVTTDDVLADLLRPVYVNQRNFTFTIYKDTTNNGIDDIGQTVEMKHIVAGAHIQDPNKTHVFIYCPYSWTVTNAFHVMTQTEVSFGSLFYIFPKTYTASYYFLIEFGDQ